MFLSLLAHKLQSKAEGVWHRTYCNLISPLLRNVTSRRENSLKQRSRFSLNGLLARRFHVGISALVSRSNDRNFCIFDIKESSSCSCFHRISINSIPKLTLKAASMFWIIGDYVPLGNEISSCCCALFTRERSHWMAIVCSLVPFAFLHCFVSRSSRQWKCVFIDFNCVGWTTRQKFCLFTTTQSV